MTMNFFTETPWETRNLGVPSYAINSESLANTCDLSGFSKEFDQVRNKHGRFFVFARIPRESMNLVQYLERLGFFVVECTVVPFIRLITHEQLDVFEKERIKFVPQKFKDSALTVSTVTNPDIELVAAIKNLASESFVDDRFHVDSNCALETADRRFVYWVEDLTNNRDVFFDLLYVKGELAGFMARKENQLILAGFSKKYRTAGLGEFLWLTSCSTIKNMSYKTAETLISINNIAVLNLYARLGFKFKDTQYSLHYWGTD